MFGLKKSNDLQGKIKSLAKKYESYVIDCRRTVHRFAETAGKEVKTAAFVRAEAEKLGLSAETVSTTGLLVTLDTGRPGNGVALRADMDALPVKENACNLSGPREVVSDDPETCHACGHDAHTAMLLGAMQVLYELRDSLKGTVYFCFEEGEEIGSGWDGMLEALAEKNVNTVFGLHAYAALEHGLVSIEAGPRMAGTINVNATFNGRGGHGSRPDLSVNPVYAAANAICNLTVAAANQLNVNETVTLGITGISGSSTNNIIPDQATVLGSLRFFDPEEGKKAVRLLHSVFNHTAAMHGCTVDYMLTDIVLYPVINDPAAASLAESALAKVLPAGAIVHEDKWFASESFSQYLRRYKGVFGFLGIKNAEKGSGAEHHNEYFDVDESVLVNGVLCHAAYAAAALADDRVASWTRTEVEDEEYEEEYDFAGGPAGNAGDAQIAALAGPDESAANSPAAGAEADPDTNSAQKGTQNGAETGGKKPRPNAKYTLDTKIGVLLKSQGAKDAVSSVCDGLVNHPQIGFAKGMSIRKASKFLPSVLTPEMLSKIEIALSEVDD